MATSKKVVARFFAMPSGEEPVRAWLRTLTKDERFRIGVDIQKVEFGWPIGLPVCRALGDGLWEVRSSLASKREARVIFCFKDGQIVLLHSFIKKTQKTPGHDLEVARKRMASIED